MRFIWLLPDSTIYYRLTAIFRVYDTIGSSTCGSSVMFTRLKFTTKNLADLKVCVKRAQIGLCADPLALGNPLEAWKPFH